MSGVRAGAIVFAGVGLTNLCNYVFHALSAHALGPASYGDVATLAVVSGILTLPLGGAQVFVARHVARQVAPSGTLQDGSYVSGFAAASAAAGGLLTLALLAFSPLIQSALSIRSLWAVVFGILFTVPSFLAPVLLGAIQGLQRFVLFAVALGLPSVLRVALAELALTAGLGVPGVMAATLLAGLCAVAIPLVALRASLGFPTHWRPRLPRSEARALVPVLAGMLAVTCLSSDDLVAAKVSLSAHDAGLYSSASLIGRVILYLPAAIVTVLLPRVSARVSAARGTTQIYARSLVATGVFCLAVTAAYAAVPQLILRATFGAKYEGIAPILWMFGAAMTIYALLNVVLTYRIGHGETMTCWLLLAGAIIQACVFALAHSSARELVTVSIASGTMLLLASVAGRAALARLRLGDVRQTTS